jgi:hypothetical protein
MRCRDHLKFENQIRDPFPLSRIICVWCQLEVGIAIGMIPFKILMNPDALGCTIDQFRNLIEKLHNDI